MSIDHPRGAQGSGILRGLLPRQPHGQWRLLDFGFLRLRQSHLRKILSLLLDSERAWPENESPAGHPAAKVRRRKSSRPTCARHHHAGAQALCSNIDQKYDGIGELSTAPRFLEVFREGLNELQGYLRRTRRYIARFEHDLDKPRVDVR